MEAPEPETSQEKLIRETSAAMKRAALRAREVARQTGTQIVIMRDGKIVHLSPDDPSLDK